MATRPDQTMPCTGWRDLQSRRSGRVRRIGLSMKLAAGLAVLALRVAACGSDATPESGSTQGGGSSGSATPSAGAVVPTVTGDVAKGLNAPWSILRIPNGPGGEAVLLSERDSGRILRLDPASGSTSSLTQVPELANAGEGGLMATFSSAPIVLAPAFKELRPTLERMQRDIVGGVENKADSAQDAADSAQDAADAAQGDATLSFAQVAALAEKNEADIKKINFLRQWYGS